MQQRKDALRTMILGLQATGMIVIIAASFMGGLYIFNGNMLYSMPASLFFVVAMFYLVSYFMKEKANRKRKGYPVQFYYAFTAYILLSLVVSFFVLHCFNVEFIEKKEIQRIGLSKLSCLQSVYDDYQHKYQKFLKKHRVEMMQNITFLKTHSQSFQIQPVITILKSPPYNFSDQMILDFIKADPLSASIDINIRTLENMFKTSEMNLLSDKDVYFQIKRNTFEGWNRLTLNSSILELNQKLGSDYLVLNRILSEKTDGQSSLEKPDNNCMQLTLIDKPFQLALKNFGIGTLSVVLIFNLLILLPYFLTGGRRY